MSAVVERAANTVVGSSPNRVGGIDRVTGTQAYVADIRLPDVLEAKLVTLDCAHARIIAIDTRDARARPRGACGDDGGRPPTARAAVRAAVP